MSPSPSRQQQQQQTKFAKAFDRGFQDQCNGEVDLATYLRTFDGEAYLYRCGARAARQDAFYKRLEEQAERSRRLARLMSLDPSHDD